MDDSHGGNSKRHWWKHPLTLVAVATVMGAMFGGPVHRHWDSSRYTSDMAYEAEKHIIRELRYEFSSGMSKIEDRLQRMDERNNLLAKELADTPSKELLSRVTILEERQRYQIAITEQIEENLGKVLEKIH